jgi:hypothetical protein
VRIIDYSGLSKLQTKLVQIFTRVYAVGYQDLVQSIYAQLPQNEVIEHALRKE